MEARTKIIAAVAVIMMCAAGLVGAGYAYTATTVNDGNSASTEYITLVQGEAGAYNFADGVNIYWDSYDKKIRAADTGLIGKQAYTDDVDTKAAIAVGDMVTQYTLSSAIDEVSIPGLTLVSIGDEFTLNPTYSKDADRPTISIEFEATGFDMPSPDDATIWMKAGNELFKLTTDDTFTEYTSATVPGGDGKITVTGGGAVAYSEVTVQMFYGFESENYVGILAKHASGAVPDVVPPTDLLTGASLEFEITVNEWNGYHLDIAEGEVTVEGDNLVINAILPTGWNAENIVWTTSNPAFATVAGNGTAVGTVSAVAAGVVTITATYNGMYSVTCEVTVNAA